MRTGMLGAAMALVPFMLGLTSMGLLYYSRPAPLPEIHVIAVAPSQPLPLDDRGAERAKVGAQAFGLLGHA
jgi:hypothetical protein